MWFALTSLSVIVVSSELSSVHFNADSWALMQTVIHHHPRKGGGDSEYPDANDQVVMKYEDWECAELCESHPSVVNGGEGCCQFEKIVNGGTKCTFYAGKTRYKRDANYRSFKCGQSVRGAGDCNPKGGWGKRCTGDDPQAPIVPAPDHQNLDNKYVSYNLVWEDRFTDCTNLLDHWSYEYEQRKDRLQWYTDTQAKCTADGLVITAERKTPMEVGVPETRWRKTSKAGNFEYISSSLTSIGKRYFTMGGCGMVELKAKVDTRSGGFPAWWAMGDFMTPEHVQCEWPGCGEIDMMEFAGKHGWMKTNFCIGEGGDASGSVGSGGNCNWQNRITSVDEEWSKKWHTWTMSWNEGEDSIQVFLDGVLYLKQTFSAADPEQTGRTYNPWRNKDHYMIINLAIGFVGGDPELSTFPMKLEVNYVKYMTCPSNIPHEIGS